MKFLKVLAEKITNFFEKYYPDPFAILIFVTIFIFSLTFIFTNTSVIDAVNYWGDGLVNLLSFMAQLSFMMLVSYALVNTKPVDFTLSKIAAIPNNVNSAYRIVILTSTALALISWSFGLVGGAIIALHVGRACQKKNIKIHFPLLVAAAYSGMMVWHMGLSGSAPLFVATDGHSLISETGIIKVSETIFSMVNLLSIIVIVSILLIVIPLFHPSETKGTIKENIQDKDKDETIKLNKITNVKKIDNINFATAINENRYINLFLAIPLLIYLILYFYNNGFNLNLNIVNWSLLCALLFFAKSINEVITSISKGGKTISSILLQYPFYAALANLMAQSSLVKIISGFFISISSKSTLLFFTFISAAILNVFIPSGGGQWVIQGPIFIDAANNYLIDHKYIVLAVAYGDQLTNMIQPFWAIPLVALVGISVKDIMGYCLFICLTGFFVYSTVFLYIGLFLL